jgi:predicted ATP-grasp superfamily ATP-dependent carboligase
VKNRQIKVLLLDGHTVQVLPLAKSLRKNGHHVTIFSEEKLSYGWVSRFPHKKILSPSAYKEPELFLTFLIEHLKVHDYDILVPLFDDSAGILGEHKEELSKYAKIVIPDYDAFIQGHDKNLTMKVAKKIGVPHPKTMDLEENSLDDAVAYCGLPSLIKPNIGAGAKGITKVDTREELQRLYPKIRKEFGASTLQEFIPPGGKQFKCQIFRDRDGSIKGATTFVKHRYFPVTGGTTSCGEIVDIPELVEYASRVADEINWIGFGDFDSIEDPRDGSYKLMEINTRITGSIKAGMESGVDYAQMIVEQEMGMPVSEYHATPGLVMRQLALDVMWFIYSNNKERISTKPSWFKFFGYNIKYQDGEWSDPLPMIAGFIAGAKKFISPSFRRSKMTFNNKDKKEVE